MMDLPLGAQKPPINLCHTQSGVCFQPAIDLNMKFPDRVIHFFSLPLKCSEISTLRLHLQCRDVQESFNIAEPDSMFVNNNLKEQDDKCFQLTFAYLKA